MYKQSSKVIMKGAKQSRVDELYSRVEALEQMALMTFDMANKTRHIMTRIENYQEAYDKYLADAEKVKETKQIDLTDEE